MCGQITKGTYCFAVNPLYSGRNQFAAQAREALASETNDGPRDAYFKQVVEFFVGKDVNVRAGRETERTPAPQPSRVVVGDLANDDLVASAKLGESLQVAVT